MCFAACRDHGTCDNRCQTISMNLFASLVYVADIQPSAHMRAATIDGRPCWRARMSCNRQLYELLPSMGILSAPSVLRRVSPLLHKCETYVTPRMSARTRCNRQFNELLPSRGIISAPSAPLRMTRARVRSGRNRFYALACFRRFCVSVKLT